MPLLQEMTAGLKNVELVHGDMLKLSPGSLLGSESTYSVVANIPYYITSALIRH